MKARAWTRGVAITLPLTLFACGGDDSSSPGDDADAGEASAPDSAQGTDAAAGDSGGGADATIPPDATVPDAGPRDSGPDGGTDAGTDSGTDSGSDADADADAGTDSGSDADADSGSDAGADAGSDADTGDSGFGFDAGADGGSDSGSGTGADAGTDGGDAGPCGISRGFQPGVPVGGVGSGQADDYNIKLSLDELSAYFSGDQAGDDDIYSASRGAIGSAFGSIAMVSTLSAAGRQEYWASPSEAGRLVVLERDSKLYMSTRATSTDPWSAPVAPPELDLSTDAGMSVYTGQPHLMADGTTLYFASTAAGSWDLYRASWTGAGWTTPTTVSEINTTTATEWAPTVTADGLTIYFGSNRPASGSGALEGNTMWAAQRATVNDPFGTPRKVAELDLGADEWPSWISADGCRLYYSQKVFVGNSTDAYRAFVATQ